MRDMRHMRSVNKACAEPEPGHINPCVAQHLISRDAAK